jgi:hypothetical protein
LFFLSPLGNRAHPSPSTTASDIIVSFLLSNGTGSLVQQAGLPLWPALHRRGRTARSWPITSRPFTMMAFVGFSPLNRSGGSRHRSPITHAINRWRRTNRPPKLPFPIPKFACCPPLTTRVSSSPFQCLAHGSRGAHLPIFSSSTPTLN